jgi:nitroimidazol reductase NimA-like FMN-containing flavoprotein (pyridoxamine 5'-phosphate oxidase superfamily)
VPTTDEDRRYEVLAEAECHRLLGTVGTGRLGFTHGALPAILPVPFSVRDGHVMIPARRGSAVVSAVRGAVVAFEVDTYDAATRTGWSVTVVGPTRLISASGQVAALEESRFAARPPAPDRCYIAVQLSLLRGWRVSETTPEATSGRPGSRAEPRR